MTPEDLMKKFKEELKEHDESLEKARVLSRKIIVRMIILCSSAIAFSVSLFSIEALKPNIDITMLKYSWYIFLATMIIGFLQLFLEGRLNYVIPHRAFQPMGNIKEYNLTALEFLRIIVVIAISSLYPTNLLFCRIYKDENKKKKYENLNGFTVHYLARLKGLYFILEDIFIITFVTALILFILSVSI